MANVINKATLDLVKRFEGLGDGDKDRPGLQPYICPAGYWTVGYGRVVRGSDGRMFKGEVDRRAANAVYPDGIDEQQASTFLAEDMAEVGRQVAARVTVALTGNQIGACASFAYNVGIAAFASSTLLKKLNVGDFAAVAAQFLVWNKATDPRTGRKVELPGLTRRRRAEQALFLSP
ncbi:lysozyme [Niveispirillum sp.]|uniref:lysozyme n=1 Tax=Niveispirillum sp. TaxID=1917217 RepID=UPI001B7C622A|nr:lysozyme [Niveispirillum sp.]MBP7336771.1 lysozyme [Niveispirillum sp.]